MTRKIKVLLASAALAITACSLVVDTNKDQCTTNSDCASGATCSDGVCVLGGGPGADGGDGQAPGEGGPGDGGGDCSPKVPVTQADLLNERCTNATCTDFDNCARLGLCNDAALPPLVDPPAGGTL